VFPTAVETQGGRLTGDGRAQSYNARGGLRASSVLVFQRCVSVLQSSSAARMCLIAPDTRAITHHSKA